MKNDTFWQKKIWQGVPLDFKFFRIIDYQLEIDHFLAKKILAGGPLRKVVLLRFEKAKNSSYVG